MYFLKEDLKNKLIKQIADNNRATWDGLLGEETEISKKKACFTP